ncbi:HNH endonuclease [Bacillus infantis]|uniref:HNH endonuclease signature motif containing protein n=1 Tax=Bacillus infantis TaxID=324767 RepID=UPI0020060D46|nr:HNH endonuclease signature motif containing protein [Bacillus infantis]MCK6203951.1 HNH endonuclease [Bacillus infantis]
MDFHPVPKPVSKPKEKPKYREKRPKKKKKKLETFKGRTIPPAKVRAAITKKEYNRALEAYGAFCNVCGNPIIEMHHIRFRSQQGRGTYRNLIPLCKTHHMKAHSNRMLNDILKKERIQHFGEWYWADKYDLFKARLIPNTDDKTFESYMKEEEDRAQTNHSSEV